MNRDFNEFDLFLLDLEHAAEQEPSTLQELAKKYHLGPDRTREELVQLPKDAGKRTPVEPLNVEQIIAQRRAASHRTTPGQVFTPSGPLNKAASAERPHDPLMVLLETEREPEPAPRFESAHDLGRELIKLKPGPGLKATPSTTLSDVLGVIGERAASAGARKLAKSLAARARELEVVS